MKATPTFDEFLDHCFTHGQSGSRNRSKNDADRFWSMQPATIAEYLARLFEGAARLVRRYTPDQLADGTHMIFGSVTEYFKRIREPSVPVELQVRVYEAMPRMYIDVYDKLCARCGTTNKDLSDTDELDGAVYMIWDMDCVEGAVMFPEETPHLVEPGFNVLQTVLARCQTPACLKGALHGLGHLEMYHPERVRAVIDKFLVDRQHRLPRWLMEYACHAREGEVQ